MGEGDIKISTDSAEYDSLEELIQKNKLKLKELNLIRYSPHISLYIRRGSVGGGRLSADEDAEKQFHILKELLLRKRQWFSFLSSIVVILVGIIASELSFFYILSIGKSNPYFYRFILLPIILFILSIASFASSTGRFASIDLSYSYKQQSLYERYKDLVVYVIY